MDESMAWPVGYRRDAIRRSSFFDEKVKYLLLESGARLYESTWGVLFVLIQGKKRCKLKDRTIRFRP